MESDVEGKLLYSKAQFADGLSISRPAVTKAIREGRIVLDAKTGLIDPNYPTNLRYVQRINGRKSKKPITDEFKQEMTTGFMDEEKRRRTNRIAAVPPESKTDKKFKEISSRLEKNINTKTEEGADLFDKLMSQGLLNPAEQHKVAQTTLANLKIAQEMNDLIVREMVVRCFGRLSGIMASRLLCLGQRSAKTICSIFGDMSSEKEISVQNSINDEVASAVEAIQREIADATDW